MRPEVAKSESSRHTPDHYRGKNLLFLLLAIGIPSALLYLRLVFGYVAIANHRSSAPSTDFLWASNVSLIIFFIAQLICARYLQRLLKRPVTLLADALQYVGVLTVCLLVSVCAAVLLEAFGYAFMLRVKGSSS